MIRVFLLLNVLLINHIVDGQNDEQFIKGKVIDSKTKLGIPYAQIASYKLVSVFAADSLGRFNILTSNNDSLKIFSIGFKPVIFYVNTNFSQDITYDVELEKQSILLNSVDIHPWSKESIDKNLNLPYDLHLGQENSVPIDERSDVGGKPPIFAVVEHPLTFAYYYLSKRERKKRQLKNVRKVENYQSYLTNQILSEISGFQGNELNKFRLYCNTVIHLDRHDNSQTVRFKVLDALTEFQKLPKENETDSNIK